MKVLDNKQWVSQTFQDCKLGDPRRTNRLLNVAEGMLDAPDQSLPSQFSEWSDLKAAYRFFDTEQATLDAICSPHWEQTRKTRPGRYLLISDTTDLNFTWHASTKGLGMLGDGKGRGIQLHPCLVYSLDENQVVGLAGAVTHYRAFKPKNETRVQRLARNRESDIWGRIVDKVGTAPNGSQWIHVFDRGGEYFEAMCLVLLRWISAVLRATQREQQL